MAFDVLPVRVKVSSGRAPASFSLIRRGRYKSSGAPSVWLSLGMQIGAALADAKRFVILVGRDEDAGKLRVKSDDDKGVVFGKRLKSGALSLDLGHIEALKIPMASSGKFGSDARVIGPGLVEVDVPDFSCAAGQTGDGDDDGDGDDGEEPPAGPITATPGAAKKVEVHRGVEIVFDKDHESVTYRGQSMEVTARQALLIKLLARVMPAPVSDSFIVRELWPKGAPSGGTGPAIAAMIRDLAAALKPLGLEPRLVKGAGYQLRDIA